jgi:hypothetical protein
MSKVGSIINAIGLWLIACKKSPFKELTMAFVVPLLINILIF